MLRTLEHLSTVKVLAANNCGLLLRSLVSLEGLRDNSELTEVMANLEEIRSQLQSSSPTKVSQAISRTMSEDRVLSSRNSEIREDEI